ncbi:flavin reductase family protein [Nocardiopsis tropica]|uniref:Flavin reductase family protein n=1 Tax=Nocardiopsis tropica TaxID=109330 RepID=A0ABU7KUL4_9ACTN|nr:flavin reductase family protein [Nocardiopsis umidischolae]MEE2053008.1 flavin reductase family protein [Nocardiopsis umidischolae]
MNTEQQTGPARAAASPTPEHRTIRPRILYFGTPVVLVSTANDDGTPNLAPISSVWALGHLLVLGLGATGQTARNLAERPGFAACFPAAEDWSRVERLAPLTGRDPVPPGKPPGCRFEADKFAAAGLTPQESELVAPPRVAECPLQLEARAVRADADASGDLVVVQADVLRVHADTRVVVPGTDHVDPSRWNPLIYNFRHYFGLGRQHGHSHRSETPAP